MKPILLVIGIICFFNGCESTFLRMRATQSTTTPTPNLKRAAPQTVCPLSKSQNGIGGELNVFETGVQDLTELLNDQNPDAMKAFVEKYYDLMICFVQSIGLIDNTNGEANINPDAAREMLAEVDDVDPQVHALINDELTNCADKSEGAELINCVFVGMDKVCGFGLLPNLAAQQS